jgi:hypothetical protein
VTTELLELDESLVFVVNVLEEDVGVEETDELVWEGVELGGDENGDEVGVFEDDEESLVGVADVLAGVDDELAAALLGELDEV